LKNNTLSLIIKYLRARSKIHIDVFNNYNYLNLENGLYDLDNYTLIPHSSEIYSTIRLNPSYKEDEKCELWEETLHNIIDNQDDIDILQEFFGLCLTRETYDRALFLTGEGGTGKSTLIEVLTYILGDDNTSTVPLENLDRTHYVAQLHNKLLNVATEISAKASVHDGFFKGITTNDKITGDHKFGHPFKFRPFCKLLYATNNMPRTDDKTSGFYRRLLIIQLKRKFEGKDAKHRFYEKLLLEKDGIFNWMIVGLKRLRTRGYFSINKHMIENIEEYKKENNPIRAFIEECCVIDPIEQESKREIYNAYKIYCIESGFKSLSIIKFGKELQRCINENIFKEERNREGHMWKGIGLTNKINPTELSPHNRGF